MNPHTARAQLLMQRGRYDEAVSMLGRALAEDPEDGRTHALLGACHTQTQDYAEAEASLRRAITLGPEDSLAYFLYGDLLARRARLDEATKMADAALRLNPRDPSHYALRSDIAFRRHRWKEALSWAEKGLAQDAEHTESQNLRSMALTRLRRSDEAADSVRETLRSAPENATAHANEGWRQLHANRPKDALEHFREALRIEPGHEYAKHGLVEALKARNPVYRLLLGYMLWMVSLSPRARNGLLIGGYVGYRILGSIARNNPDLAPWLRPILWSYIAFALLTWVGYPMFNLMLRLSPYGRHALSRDQVLGSNVFGLMLLGTLASLGLALGTGRDGFWTMTLVLGVTTLPVSAWMQLRGNTRFVPVGIGVAVVGILGLLAIADAWVGLGGLPLFTLWLITAILLELFIVFGGLGHQRE